MDDINVRKALIMSINPVDMAKAAYPQGPYTPATQILNKVAGVDPDFQPYPYDPEGAKKALAASKYKEGRLLPKIMFVGISTPTHEAAAQYMAEQWRKVLGIQGVEMKADIETYSGPDQKSVQIFRDDVGTRVPDAVSYLMGSIHSTSGNARGKMGGYKNPKVDALLDEAKAKSVQDPARIKGAQEAQTHLPRRLHVHPVLLRRDVQVVDALGARLRQERRLAGHRAVERHHRREQAGCPLSV
jgi:peptide/nickel transport system substrate-binding protein